jgi:hypothetical protein
MKVLVKSAVMALLVLATSPLLANNENTLETLVSVKILEPGKMQLAYYGKTPERILVNIYNDENQRIFNETIQSKTGIKKPYNLRELPYGEYRVKVKVDGEITEHTIMHKAPEFPGKVKMMAAAFGEGKVKMMLMSPHHKKYRLRIYDTNNELLYQQDINQKQNFGRVFNFTEHDTKSVRIVLSSSQEILQRKTVNL